MRSRLPWMNFDVEAFFHFNGHLYLFTKADGDAIGYTKMYRLSDDPGSYSATLVDSFLHQRPHDLGGYQSRRQQRHSHCQHAYPPVPRFQWR